MIATFKCLYLFELLDQQSSSIWDTFTSWEAGHLIFRKKEQTPKECSQSLAFSFQKSKSLQHRTWNLSLLNWTSMHQWQQTEHLNSMIFIGLYCNSYNVNVLIASWTKQSFLSIQCREPTMYNRKQNQIREGQAHDK